MNDTDANDEISHDKVFKTLFRAFFKDFVEIVHPELAEALDLAHPEFLDVPGFANLRKHGHVVPDLLAKTSTLSGEPRLVLTHVEAESRFTTAMDARMEEYFMHLTLEYDCPVISIAVFLRGGEPGIERRQVVREVAGWESSRFSYLAFGLSGSLAEDYVDRPQPLAAALAALMHSEVWDNLERRLQCLRAVRRAEVEKKERFLLTKVVNTYIQLSEPEQARFAAELEKRANQEVREMVLTWDETMAECRAEGEARGRAEGQRTATREAIVLALKHRWADVSARVLENLEAIDDLDRLHELLAQALKGRSIDDLDL